MEKLVERILNAANQRFYAENAATFSDTRRVPWTGWNQVSQAIEALKASEKDVLRILDIGCGNMRFEAFLRSQLPRVRFSFTCLDSCAAMAVESEDVDFIACDIVERLLEDAPFMDVEQGCFDAVVAFGLMHHIPGQQNRELLLQRMASHVRDEGLLAVSFWQFLENDRLSRKAHEMRQQALMALDLNEGDLEPGDAFLGWAEEQEAIRYCHSFTDEEIEGLLMPLKSCSSSMGCYKADTANEYAIIKIKHNRAKCRTL